MNITEKHLVKLIKEEYDKRLQYFLNENMDLDSIGDADQLKVRHAKTRYEYTIGNIEGDFVQLFLPDEPRYNPSEYGQKRLISGHVLEQDDDYEHEEFPSEDERLRTEDDRDYILVDRKTFEGEYELA